MLYIYAFVNIRCVLDGKIISVKKLRLLKGLLLYYAEGGDKDEGKTCCCDKPK